MDNLIGKRFSKLKVICNAEEKNKEGQEVFLCQCDCGKIKKVVGRELKRGRTRTCGSKNCIDDLLGRTITGKKFGRLLVCEKMPDDIEPYKSAKGIFYRCICDCGNEIICKKRNIVEGTIKSCGCLAKENRSRIGKTANIKHGMCNQRIYSIWKAMKQRCYNDKEKSYRHYGGRGITICQEWIGSFQAFYKWAMANGYSDKLSIDRIDVNGNYEPQNCRWATQKEQMNNVTYNVHYQYQNKLYTQTQLCETFGISPSTLSYRLKKGIKLEDALIKTERVGKVS